MERIRSLDSLRGLAALVVVLYHFSLVLPGVHPRLESIWPLRIVLAGETAVLLFFVLSGFVLYLSLLRHDRDNYTTFAARRLARLYPPVAAAVLLSAALCLLVDSGPLPGLEGWLTTFSWTERPGPALVAGHLLLLDTDRFHTLDNPMWSLVVEIRLSLVFPFLAAGIRRRPLVTVICCLVLSALARAAVANGHQIRVVDPVLTLEFLDLFAIGALLARYRAQVTPLLGRLPAPFVAAAALGVLCIYDRFTQYFRYGGAILLVAATVAYQRWGRFYGARPLVWLGERSFSLYLIHVPVLLAVLHAFGNRVPVLALLACAFVASFLTAEVFWWCVERPAIDLSRYIGGRLTLRRSTALPKIDAIG